MLTNHCKRKKKLWTFLFFWVVYDRLGSEFSTSNSP